jgi:AcrR family transcriptional regulator
MLPIDHVTSRGKRNALIQRDLVDPAPSEEGYVRRPRERILQAACELFYRHGIHAASVDAIAELAATNKMTLYRHFKSKDDLIAEYLRLLAIEGDAIWVELERNYPGDAEAQLEGWMTHVEHILTNRLERGCALANAAVELQPDHPARHVIEAYKRRKRERLVRLFQAARYAEPEQLADEVFLLFEGARISIQCAGPGGPASRLIGVLRSLLASAPKQD